MTFSTPPPLTMNWFRFPESANDNDDLMDPDSHVALSYVLVLLNMLVSGDSHARVWRPKGEAKGGTILTGNEGVCILFRVNFLRDPFSNHYLRFTLREKQLQFSS